VDPGRRHGCDGGGSPTTEELLLARKCLGFTPTRCTLVHGPGSRVISVLSGVRGNGDGRRACHAIAVLPHSRCRVCGVVMRARPAHWGNWALPNIGARNERTAAGAESSIYSVRGGESSFRWRCSV
jgi:hypothetical protein